MTPAPPPLYVRRLQMDFDDMEDTASNAPRRRRLTVDEAQAQASQAAGGPQAAAGGTAGQQAPSKAPQQQSRQSGK